MADGEHDCEQMPDEGVRVARTNGHVGISQWDWCLVVERLATEEHLEANHYLEQFGDLVWCTIIGIAHCPFCGMQLDPLSEAEKVSRPAEFVHVDGSGWAIEIR